MTIAAKHFDPVVGIDTHIVAIPTPGGPVPTPIPHPYVGSVFDAIDYLPGGASVLVNGLPRGHAGSAVLFSTPHIPMGGMFTVPPSNEAQLFHGSTTVVSEGEPQALLGLSVLDCQDIGIPAPPRPRKTPPKSMVAPVGTLLSIPAGRMVMIGGPPAPFSITQMAEALAGKLVERLEEKLLFGALKKVAKLAGKRRKRISDFLRKKSSPAMKRRKVGDAKRNQVHKKDCKLTGHPVDVATGKVLTEQLDLALSGPIPFTFSRIWYSTSTYKGPLGHGWHHAYDMALLMEPQDDLLLLRTADGRHVPFPALKQGQGHVDDSERLVLTREVANSYTLTDAEQLRYRFTEVGRTDATLMLTSIQDHVGYRIELRYDRRGRLSEIVDSASRSITFGYDEQGRIQQMWAPHPSAPQQRVALCSYGYDSEGNLSAACNALGDATGYRYDRTLLIEETDRKGLSFYFEYDGPDETAKCTRTYGDGGIYDHRLTYAPGVTTVVNSLGHTTLYRHWRGLVVETTDPRGGVARCQYDPNRLLLHEQNPLGQATRYEYDDWGNPSLITAADGSQVCITYDNRNRPREAIDEVGGRFRWEYDASGRLTERQDPLGHVTRFSYAERLLSAITDPEGAVTAFMYDGVGNLVQVREPSGALRQWEYDHWGRPLQAIDPLGNRQQRRYDLLGRVTHVAEPDGNQRTLDYDAEGNLVRLQDGVQDVRFAYCGMGRLRSRSQAETTVYFEYDTEEQLTAVVNEHGLRYGFELDPCGRVHTERSFDGLARHYDRDLAGRVTVMGRPGDLTTHYERDPLGRVTEVRHWNREAERYQYRADGLLMAAENSATKVTFERDLLGRILREQQGEHWVSSDYDRRGLRSRLQSSMGADVSITRNAMGDAIQVGDARGFKAHIRRDALGLEIERALPGGLRRTWRRDRLGRPQSHDIKLGNQLLRGVSYSWSVDDRLISLLDSLAGTAQYGHNALGYLEWARYSDGSAELRMPDAVGNLFKTKSRSDRKYGPAGQLLQAKGTKGTTFYTYDLEGNLIEKRAPLGRTWRYRWSPEGTLTEVSRPDGTCVSFKYDALGRRVEKTYRGQTTRWVWDGNTPLHEWVEGDLQRPQAPEPPTIWSADAEIKRREADLQAYLLRGPPERGTLSAPITWLFDPESFAPMARLQGDDYQSILCDHLGTPIAVVDLEGNARWQAAVDTYGQLRELEGERHTCLFRFPGQYEDLETGLYYNRFRYYDPDSGHYTQHDPIGLAGGTALRGYVHDPLTWVDTLGLACGDANDPLGEPWSPGQQALNKVPASWGKGKPTKKGVGVRWTDPANPGNGIRIDRGNPANSQVTQQVDHVIVRHKGKVIGRNGRPIEGSVADNAAEAHIPLSEWTQWSSWSGP